MYGNCDAGGLEGLAWERIGESDNRPAVLFMPGGCIPASICYRGDLDNGSDGWADVVADAGIECWVADWAEVHRRGVSRTKTVYDDVVAAFEYLIREQIRRPVVIVCHSMSGTIAWVLATRLRSLVAGIVALAPGPPDAAPIPHRVISDDGEVIEILLESSKCPVRVDRRRLARFDEDYINRTWIGTSTQHDGDLAGSLAARIGSLSPLMLLQRFGVMDGIPVVGEGSPLAGLPVRIVTGEFDPNHSRSVDQRTVDVLTARGAAVDFTWLPDIGIRGNGHVPFVERNSADVVCVLKSRILDLVGA